MKSWPSRVEEARDADGLRFFRYDWRGLLVQASHRFWSQKDGSGRTWDNGTSDLWTTGTAWDPAIPSAPRATLSDWLVLDDLTDTTTVTLTLTYDAAARPTGAGYPEGMATRMTYNDATRLAAVEVDRGTGTGFVPVISDLRYDARGQLVAPAARRSSSRTCRSTTIRPATRCACSTTWTPAPSRPTP